MKKEIIKHIFTDGTDERVVCADTKAEAAKQLDQAISYGYLGTETVPLVNAPFAQELLDTLGEGWTAEPISGEYRDTQFSFRNADGVGFWVRGEGKRWEFRYDRPHESRGHTYSACWPDGRPFVSPSITCAKSKSGEQLAKDINRRLLPDCEEAEVLCQEAIRQAQARRAKEKVAREVASELNSVSELRFLPNGVHVQVEGYVTPETAKEIHKLLSK